MSNNSSSADADDGGLNYVLLFRLIVWGYIGIVLSLFGIVGNIITVIVLISPSMRTTSTNMYLTALSCSNILFLLIFIPSYSIRYLLGYRLYMTNQPPFAFEILLIRLPTTPVYNTISLSMIYLTVAVSMDRLILLKFPLKAKQILTQRTTLITILLIYIFSIVYCIPYWLEQKYNPELKQCQITKIGIKTYKYTRIYIYIPVVYVIPFVTLTCINITIIQNLIAKKRRKISLGATTSKKKQADYHITLMLVTVIIVFVLSQLPLLILNAWYAINSRGAPESLLFHSLNSLGILLIVVNTSTNFLLYCFFGQKFRQTLIQYILHLMPNKRKQSNLQPRISKLSKEQCPQHRMTTNIPATIITDLKIDSKIKTNELNHQILIESSTTQNKNVTNNMTTVYHEERCPLIINSEQIIPINENSPPKQTEQLNLYTCANGKRILVLKI